MKKMKIVPMSPMEKLLPGAVPAAQFEPLVATRNGRLCFQVAFTTTEKLSYDAPLLTVRTTGTLPCVQLYAVELVPCTLPAYYNADDTYLTKTQSLIPDRLVPLSKTDTVRLLCGYWQVIWVEIYDPKGLPAGSYTISLQFFDPEHTEWGSVDVPVQIEDTLLAPQTFFHSEWLHLDCLCHAHHCKPFSKRFWQIAQAYLHCQIDHGINVAWVPVFTPPLDTAVGKERMTVQMVQVQKQNEQYFFDFSVLQQWLSLCRSLGFCRFEFSHLFTQWGALHCPKIMIKEGSLLKKAFGWHTDAVGEDYRAFLAAFLPQLRTMLIESKIWNQSMFHISDEPTEQNAADYAKAKNIIQKIVPDISLWETLSDYSLYQKGLVEHPIPSIDKASEFYANEVKNFWVYYSCVNGANCPNRFLSLPLSRVRAIGEAALSCGASGFLHWGFNFWNTQHSLTALNPSVVTDSGGAFPSGDAFVVYPGKNAPNPSIRLKILALAMEDTRKRY